MSNVIQLGPRTTPDVQWHVLDYSRLQMDERLSLQPNTQLAMLKAAALTGVQCGQLHYDNLYYLADLMERGVSTFNRGRGITVDVSAFQSAQEEGRFYLIYSVWNNADLDQFQTDEESTPLVSFSIELRPHVDQDPSIQPHGHEALSPHLHAPLIPSLYWPFIERLLRFLRQYTIGRQGNYVAIDDGRDEHHSQSTGISDYDGQYCLVLSISVKGRLLPVE